MKNQFILIQMVAANILSYESQQCNIIDSPHQQACGLEGYHIISQLMFAFL